MAIQPSLTLPSSPPDPAMNYAVLRRQGIQHLESMAGSLWTDFNAHDPGITILEQLCYAITDLAYRIDYALPDILASGDGNAYASLSGPAAMLTSQPVTLSDLRKRIIDIEGVKNAWIEKVETLQKPLYYHSADSELSLQSGESRSIEPIHLRGLYRVLIEKSEASHIDGSLIKNAVIRCLHANRNLCEDFEEILLLEEQRIPVHAYLEIAPVEDAEKLLRDIYQKIAGYISPDIPFYNLRQMLQTGRRIDEIFDGPLLQHGFIDSAELQRSQRKTVLYQSDLIREIMDVPEVRGIRHIHFASADPMPQAVTREAWSLPLESKQSAKLDWQNSRIILLRNGQQIIDSGRIKITPEAAPAARREKLDLSALQLPPGHNRNIGRYYSIQHQFPATYGIGEAGLPASADDERKAQAKQLKAYLLFFDQLLANYFAQLAHAGEFFSFRQPNPQTYFSQIIDDPTLGLDALWMADAETRRVQLQAITENPYRAAGSSTPSAAAGSPNWARKNRFLNHLLARFAEQFTDYSLMLYHLQAGDSDAAAARLVADKQAFLQNYQHIGSRRGSAYNYLAPQDNANCSGLEQRIRLKLGIHDADEEFYLVEHILLRPLVDPRVGPSEGDERQQAPLLAVAEGRPKDPFSLQLSFVFPDWPERFRQDSGFRGFVEQTIREETPAHLLPYVHWFDRQAMQIFRQVYDDWLAKRRAYWNAKLGI